MKKLLSLFTALVLLIISMLGLVSCNNTEKMTVVGEISYIKSLNSHCVYIRPLEQGSNGVWIPVEITENTSTPSDFSNVASDMPELAIGTIVEVVYNVSEEKNESAKSSAYKAISLKVVSDADMHSKQDSPLKLSKGYEYTTDANDGNRDFGTVVHVAKLEAPISGYLIYLDNNRTSDNQTLTIYWVDEKLLKEDGLHHIGDEVKALIESGATGYEIAVLGLSLYPFEKMNIQSITYIDFYDPNCHW